MTAEQIVRALAAEDAPVDTEYADCKFCGAAMTISSIGLQEPANHEPGCPWRLAREWTEAHP